jgi:L-2,4-diaminobutyric acid acetyltransferase
MTIQLTDRRTTFRTPAVADARGMVRVAAASRVLDMNSDYTYLLFARDFNETCLVVEEGDQMLGFATAYRPPRHPDVLFIWQIAVAEAARGEGLASRMLDDLVRRGLTAGIQFVEATVTGSNSASKALFKSLARRHNATCKITEEFPANLFETSGHESEELYRVGPFPVSGLGLPPLDEESTVPD